MDIMKMGKCLYALVKCGKVLYFIKKLVCLAAVAVLVGGVSLSLMDKKKIKKLRSKLKAVI